MTHVHCDPADHGEPHTIGCCWCGLGLNVQERTWQDEHDITPRVIDRRLFERR